MLIEAKGLRELIERMEARGERVRKLQPALQFFGERVVKKTDDCFRNQQNWDGTPFADLKPSTISARVRRSKGMGKVRAKRAAIRARYAERGKTKRAATAAVRRERVKHMVKSLQRRAELTHGGITILVDTARARNSNHVDPPRPLSVLWSAVGYLGYHMTGTKRMERRNPTPFNYKSEGVWELADDAGADLDGTLRHYIISGDPDYGAK